MFDFGNAAVLGLVLVGLVSLAKSLVYGTTESRIVALTCLLIAFVGVQLVAASDFARQQVLLDVPLNAMNFWSQLVVALLASGIASGIWQGYIAVKNIGQSLDQPRGESGVPEHAPIHEPPLVAPPPDGHQMP